MSAIRWVIQTRRSFRPCRKLSRCSATGAMKHNVADADVISAPVRTAAWVRSPPGNPGRKPNESRNANRICTPVWATRSSWTSSE